MTALHPPLPALRRLLLKRILPGCAAFCLLAALGILGYVRLHRPAPLAETEIFQGVFYRCLELPSAPDCAGRLCLVRVDLETAGVEIAVTPLNADAVAAGWQHTMRWPARWVKEEGWAVAMTATMFEAKHPWFQLPGTWTRSAETLVADHQISHVDPHTYLLWFGDDGLARLERTKPPSPAALAKAKWGVGGQGVLHCPSRPPPSAGETRDRRCVVGIDAAGKQLFLAAFEDATLSATGRRLADFGVEWAMPLDGGASASMTLGPGAKGAPSGPLMLPWRGVPTLIGVRARPLDGRKNP